jgi:hypothetical protein
VAVDLDPSTLNASSNGNWIKATVDSHEWDLTRLDATTVQLNGVSADLSHAVPTDNPLPGLTESSDVVTSDADPAHERTFRFARSSYTSLGAGPHDLAFTGHTFDGALVVGWATLNVTGGDVAKHAARKLPVRHVGGVFGDQQVAFTLDQTTVVSVDVVDLQGRVVDHVMQSTLDAGSHQVGWSGASHAPSGVYFVRVRTANAQGMTRILVAR